MEIMGFPFLLMGIPLNKTALPNIFPLSEYPQSIQNQSSSRIYKNTIYQIDNLNKMNKTKVIAALAKAATYEISGEEFIKRIIDADVTSYLIDINNFTVTFKGAQIDTFASQQNPNDPIILNLLNTNRSGEPLMIHLLKKVGVTHYEVFTNDLRMVYYEESGEEKEWSY